jgi:hypothetical protein
MMSAKKEKKKTAPSSGSEMGSNYDLDLEPMAEALKSDPAATS